MTAPKMTRAEALAEAKRRYGMTAWVRKLRTGTKACEVYRMIPPDSGPLYREKVLGFGDSWEEAFRQADVRGK